MALLPTIPSFADGASSSSQQNQLADAIRWLYNVPIAELRQTSAQTVTNATATAVTFDVEDKDDDIDGVGGHSTSSNTSRFTARYPGWYETAGEVAWAANATGRRVSWWTVNGIAVNSTQLALPATAASDGEFPARTKQIYLATGDYVELIAYQESGGNLATLVSFAVAQSGASIRWVHA